MPEKVEVYRCFNTAADAKSSQLGQDHMAAHSVAVGLEKTAASFLLARDHR
jgi:hypothetical protein